MAATDPSISTIGPVTLSAQSHTTQAYRYEVSRVFADFLQSAERFTGAFSVSDAGDVMDWGIAGDPGASGAHYQSTFTVDPAASKRDAAACARRLAEGFAT